MTKRTGLAHAMYVNGVDLSRGIQALGTIGGGHAPIDMTDITQSAMDRQGGIRDGRMEVNSYLDSAAGSAHVTLSAIPSSEEILSYCAGTSIGDPVACLVAKQASYDASRPQDGSLLFNTAAQSTGGNGLEWCELLTAGTRVDTGATNGASLDLSAGTAYLQLPGSSGNTATTPDAAALDIVGDIDIRAKIAPDDWTPAADSYIVSKYTVSGNQRSYALILSTTGTLVLQFSTDGTASTSKASTANLSALANGAIKWVRATMDVDNGASGYTVRFYTSDDGSTWTQLGADVVTATATSIFASTAVLELGSRNAGTGDFFAGKIFEADVKNGIGGTSVAHPVATLSGITDVTGRVWTVNGTAFLTSQTLFGLQAFVHVPAFTGTDATIKLQHSKDNSNWSDVTGGAFSVISTAPQAQRLQTARTLPIQRYLRVVTTTSGGFSSLSFMAAVAKNLVEVTFHA